MFGNDTLRSIVEHAVDGIITISDRGLILAVNDSMCRLFGYERAEMIGQNVNMLMPEPYHSQHDAYLDRYKKTGQRHVIGQGREVVAKRKNGSFFPIFLSVTEAEQDGQRVFAGIIHDISSRKLAETAYRETDNMLHTILDTAVDGIIIIDSSGRIDMINPAACVLFGYESHEVIGRNIRVLMPEPDSSAHDGYMHRYQTTGERRIIGIGREVKGLRKDGSTFPFTLGVSELRLRDKVLYVGIIHDLTNIAEARQRLQNYAEELKQANENLEAEVSKRTVQLEEANQLLVSANAAMTLEVELRRKAEQEAIHLLEKEKELNELKSRFVSMASHEFRTPLAGILTSLSLLARYEGPEHAEKRIRHMGIIRSSVHNLTSILNDFLSLEKLESGRVELHTEVFPINTLAQEILAEMEGGLKNGQTIEVKLCEGVDRVKADRHLLRNILINLISNAIKYSPEGRPIELKFCAEGQFLKVDVVDQGMGIPEKDQQHMFDRLFRASNVTNIQGTGLGLNIVKRYLDLHQGTINFVSREGHGSTFTFTIPQ